MPPLKDYIEPLVELCEQASAAILEHYRSGQVTRLRTKSDDSPLTRADLASHRILSAGLAELTPDIPLLSEESPAEAIAGRREWPVLWLVDPLDGTKEFLNRTGEFTINIALIRNTAPILGMLYVPLRDEAFVGIPGHGAWQLVKTAGAWHRRSLDKPVAPAGPGITVLSSRRHRNRKLSVLLDWLDAEMAPVTRLDSGSALKFCQLAEGRGDIYPRFSPCSEWDVAAGQALVEGAGGVVVGLDGEPLRYNRRDTLLNENFIAVADRDWAPLPALLQAVR